MTGELVGNLVGQINSNNDRLFGHTSSLSLDFKSFALPAMQLNYFYKSSGNYEDEGGRQKSTTGLLRDDACH